MSDRPNIVDVASSELDQLTLQWAGAKGLLLADRALILVQAAERLLQVHVKHHRGDVQEQIGLTLHNVNNALSPLFMALEELEVGYADPKEPGGTWSLSPDDTRACLERIMDSMRDLKKAGEP